MKLAVTMKGVNSMMTDKGKKGKLTRKAMTMDRESKDRAKSRIPKQKPGFKKRGRK